MAYVKFNKINHFKLLQHISDKGITICKNVLVAVGTDPAETIIGYDEHVHLSKPEVNKVPHKESEDGWRTIEPLQQVSTGDEKKETQN